MRLRKTTMVSDAGLEDSGTAIHDLDFSDPIRALIIGFYGKRFDHSDTNDPCILDDIDKIEIVDGSDVIYSTDGTNAGAVQLYATGKRPFMAYTANSTSTNRFQVKLLFGRDESDSEYGLDCSRFTNPQLKITHSFTEAAGSWADGTQTHTVQALIAEGAPKPKGFFMTKEIYSFTKGTSGDETIDMPRDYPYRFIQTQVKDAATPIYAELSNVKVSCNFDEFVPVDEVTEDLAWDNVNRYGMQYVQHEAIGDGSDTDIKSYNQMSWNWGAWVNSWNSGQDAMIKRPYSGYSTLGRHTCPDSSGADFTSTFLANTQRALCTHYGWELFESEVIPFGNINKQTDWFDPRPWKSVRLILTQAQTDALTTKIVLQQVRPY